MPGVFSAASSAAIASLFSPLSAWTFASMWSKATSQYPLSGRS